MYYAQLVLHRNTVYRRCNPPRVYYSARCAARPWELPPISPALGRSSLARPAHIYYRPCTLPRNIYCPAHTSAPYILSRNVYRLDGFNPTGAPIIIRYMLHAPTPRILPSPRRAPPRVTLVPPASHHQTSPYSCFNFKF